MIPHIHLCGGLYKAIETDLSNNHARRVFQQRRIRIRAQDARHCRMPWPLLEVHLCADLLQMLANKG